MKVIKQLCLDTSALLLKVIVEVNLIVSVAMETESMYTEEPEEVDSEEPVSPQMRENKHI